MKIDLIKEYIEVQSLKDLDLPIPEDKRKAIKKMERQFVNKDLIPFVASMLTPMLEGVQTKIALDILYDPEKGLSVTKKDNKEKDSTEKKDKQRIQVIKKQEESLARILSDESEPFFDNVYYIKSGIVNAMIKHESDKFILLKGSVVKGGSSTSWFRPELRKKTLKDCAVDKGNYWEIISDYEFTSPSTLASFCLGRSANGWITIKDKIGRTINELLRK